MTTWTEELEGLLLEALRQAWDAANTDLFRGALAPPVLALEDTRVRLGRWRRADRLLALSRPLVRERPWGVVREVMKHEMAHQYVDEVLGVHDEAAHGPAFLRVCAERQIDARATGLPDDDDVSFDDDGGKVMRRVQKLLALAQSNNAHEAEAAANAAHRLMLEHNIEVTRRASARGYRTRTLSKATVRLHGHEKILAGVLSRHFFVDVVLAAAWIPDLGRPGTLVEASGTPENLAMAEWVHAFLLGAAERAAEEAIAAGALQRRERGRFLVGFMSGVNDKLVREKTKHVEQGLVWLGDADLEEYVRGRYAHLRQTRVRASFDDAHHRGRAAGNDVVIAQPIGEAPVERGRRLPDGRVGRR